MLKFFISIFVLLVVVAGGWLYFSAKNVMNNSTSYEMQRIYVGENDEFGSYLMDKMGFPLYVYEADGYLESRCVGSCAEEFVRFFVPLDFESDRQLTSRIETFERFDGESQYAFDGKPLYYHVSDWETGIFTGMNKPGWSIVSP